MLFPAVIAFLHSDQRNAWIKENGIEVYVRHSHRAVDDGYIACFDIANVQAKVRGKGRFTSLMTVLEALPINLYIENVTNPRLAAWFARRAGYVRDRREADQPDFPLKSPCFFRLHVSVNSDMN
jgi:hypothetical protein